MQKNETTSNFHSGFIAVIGKPNVGKSTLVNTIVGRKIAIVSSKPQTTRHRILGVKNRSNCQLVFVDTPGIHKPTHELGRYMEKTYLGEMRNADLILFLADSTHDPTDEDNIALNHLFGGKHPPESPVFLIMNKIDIVEPEKVVERQKKFESGGEFSAVFHVSALTGAGIDSLEEAIILNIPEGPPYFPPEQATDQSPEFQVSEIVREKILSLTRQEVPHCVFVHTEEMRDGETPDVIYIRAIVYVERKTQKGIIIGKNGSKLKEIGTLARKELELLLGKKIYLDLWVKVKEDWRDRKDLLRAWGYDI